MFVVCFKAENGSVDRAVPGTATVRRGGGVTEGGVDSHNVKFAAEISEISFKGNLALFKLGCAGGDF